MRLMSAPRPAHLLLYGGARSDILRLYNTTTLQQQQRRAKLKTNGSQPIQTRLARERRAVRRRPRASWRATREKETKQREKTQSQELRMLRRESWNAPDEGEEEGNDAQSDLLYGWMDGYRDSRD
jgi:hypothetical protein